MIQPVASPLPSRAAIRTGSEGRQPADRHHHRRHRGGEGHAAVFAEAVADRADHQLDRAVGQQIDRHHDRGRADRNAEIGRDLRQQQIRDPHHGLGGESDNGQQSDGGGGAAAGHGWVGGQS